MKQSSVCTRRNLICSNHVLSAGNIVELVICSVLSLLTSRSNSLYGMLVHEQQDETPTKKILNVVVTSKIMRGNHLVLTGRAFHLNYVR